ncbi:MAG: cytochrome c peroxidase [Methylobacter sp.]|nr:cytochrome c peroxidase [Methylobacter sp.]MDP2099747.1 cytochrome c peroxidase [Methylobacter sp.]MDP2430381.1 cytochrome c peroxidase [Methylobacter sp.]MDP3053549.1 cytochrome c peroxidase [Methylobacter sp.]MDP3362728.1 cytochrome c peroxidase [Methylobacter sp.]
MRHALLLTLMLTVPPAYTLADDAPTTTTDDNNLLGLPPVPIPANNPQTPAKIALGDKLFHDKRFSVDGTVSCANCHDEKKAFTDALPVSVGHNGLTGTRNAPTVLNAAFNPSQFWDGREPDLEGQAKQPLVNPVEHGLSDHQQVLEIIRTDPDYLATFQNVFNVSAKSLTIDHVAQAIASFERTLVAGNSPFDRYIFNRQKDALTAAQVRGFELFIGQGRCVSCHTIEQDHALFTDGRFHNIGVGINQIQQDVPRLAHAFLEAKNKGGDVDVMVLTDKKSSELGRFAVTDELGQIGAFKTPTLRNVELTAPYMHDGSLLTLKEVMVHYNNGGAAKADEPVNAFLSGGIRPLGLNDAQLDDLVAFMSALTSSKLTAKPAQAAH